MSPICSTLPMMAYRLSLTKPSSDDSDAGNFPQNEFSPSQDHHVPISAKFDFRNMSSDKLQSSMPDIIAAAHLTIDEQIELGTGFIENDLTKVDPNSPDTTSETKDILSGLQSYIEGDLSRGDVEGVQALTELQTKLNTLQEPFRKI